MEVLWGQLSVSNLLVTVSPVQASQSPCVFPLDRHLERKLTVKTAPSENVPSSLQRGWNKVYETVFPLTLNNSSSWYSWIKISDFIVKLWRGVPYLFCKIKHRITHGPSSSGASLVAQPVKNLPAMQETWVQSLGWERPLEEEMATHSSILA